MARTSHWQSSTNPSSMRFNEPHQLGPGHDPIHLRLEALLAGPLGAAFKAAAAEADLFHVRNFSHPGGSVEVLQRIPCPSGSCPNNLHRRVTRALLRISVMVCCITGSPGQKVEALFNSSASRRKRRSSHSSWRMRCCSAVDGLPMPGPSWRSASYWATQRRTALLIKSRSWQTRLTGIQPDLFLHQPQSGRGQLLVGPGRNHVSRAHRGGWQRHRHLQSVEPSPHTGPDRRAANAVI